MVRAGLIAGGVTLVLGLVVGFLSPLCIACLAVLAGLGAGYLAGQYDRPADASNAARLGAGAGAIAGAGAVLASIAAGLASAAVNGQMMFEQLGVPQSTAQDQALVFWGTAFLTGCCIGLFNVALMAGVGAIGANLWRQVAGNRAGGVPPAPAAM